ncbi:hypothetical protein [Yinghuangia soli]|uniref:Uncharacterized protein n=1 Tax=Yinghuangia soli TaxID=2908204 RepID=A0AA41PZ43_9ACTN|nr:hypothetical protein [Yinghuangia soli]MCF2527127.1 hypothetical protein [Yinghuangia soli]
MSTDPLGPGRSVLVDDRAVVAWLGAGTCVDTGDGTVFVLAKAATAVVMAASDDWAFSGVRDARSFTIVGPIPEDVEPRLVGRFEWFYPSGDGDREMPLHIFVRVAAGLLYLGIAGRERGREITWSGALAEWSGELLTPLSREVLDMARPVGDSNSLPGLDWLDHAADDRVAALQSFVTGWFPVVEREQPDSAAAAADAAQLPVPRPLRELYLMAAGRSRRVLAAWDAIRFPQELSLDASTGRLEFAGGNEGDWTWACDLDEDDPAVWWTWDGREPVTRREPEPLSGFLLQFILRQAMVTAVYRAESGFPCIPVTVADELAAGLRPVPLHPLHWHSDRSVLYVAPGLVVAIEHVNHNERYVSAGATHRSALRRLADAGIDWMRFDG